MHPLGGALAGGTHADNLRHAYLRAHFMNALLQDSRVVVLFDTWGQETGLYQVADDVARARTVESLDKAAARLWSMLRPGQRPPLKPRPSAFVRDTLKLHWSWLAYELLDSFFRQVAARAFGFQITKSFTVVAQSPPAPPLKWQVSFQTKKGETVTEARERLLKEMSEVWNDCERAMEEAERKARGRRPNKDTGYLRDWAEWFYRARVKQPPESISALARQEGDERRRIQVALAETERLLSLGQYVICNKPQPCNKPQRK